MTNRDINMTLISKKAVILLSGGLDSATVLAIAKSQSYDCYALSFDYGQCHNAELTAAQQLAKEFDVVLHKVVSLNLNSIGGSALTDLNIAVPEEETVGIPVTYVPARNTIFLSIALGWAEVLKADAIFIGVNAVDYSGYPDCRPEFIEAFQNLASLATKMGVDGEYIKIETPLISLSKAEIIRKGHALNVDYFQTISCYKATSDGKACGKCDSCRLRKQGFLEANVPDATHYQ